jgi:hypothetical protein
MLYNMSYPQEQPLPKPPKATAGKQSHRLAPPQPFDPADLTRRLQAVLVEQKAYSEKKRRARAEIAEKQSKEATSSKGHRPEFELSNAGNETRVGIKEKSPNIAVSKSLPERLSHVDLSNSRLDPTRSQRRSSKHDASTTATYHHVPQVAAEQFARTTTAEPATEKGLVHKLSRKALKFHLEGLGSNRAVSAIDANGNPLQHTKALRKAQSYRERLYDRNQFQRTQILEAAAEVDEERMVRSRNRHTYEGQYAAGTFDYENRKEARRVSMGDMLMNQDANRRGSFGANSSGYALEKTGTAGGIGGIGVSTIYEHRIDWTQSDETKAKHKPRIGPFLRKADSIWALRGKLSNFTKHERDDQSIPQTGSDDTATSIDTIKSPKVGFFSRFKR